MKHWNPKPLRPESNNSLFVLEDENYKVVKSETAIQRQRRLDGTPHTKLRPSRLSAGHAPVYLESDKLNKSSEKEKASSAPNVDPDAVVKAFLSE